MSTDNPGYPGTGGGRPQERKAREVPLPARFDPEALHPFEVVAAVTLRDPARQCVRCGADLRAIMDGTGVELSDAEFDAIAMAAELVGSCPECFGVEP